MQTTSVKLYSLEYSEAKTYLAAALFLAGNIVLPQLFHTIRLGGPTWLPDLLIHARGRLQVRLARGAAHGTCVARSQRHCSSGCPPRRHCPRSYSNRCCWPAPQAMPPHASAVRRSHCWQPSYSSTRRPAHWANGPSRVRSTPPCQDFRIGLPGMLLQIFGGWAFINFIIRK